MPLLSEMPDFLPLGEPGSPEELACVFGTFTNHEANLDFMRYLMRECRLAAPAAPSPHPRQQPSAVSARVREGALNGR